MIDRICISINNECNLKCAYCHFREKQNAIHKTKMDINEILQNAGEYLQKNKNIKVFKIGFVGNGEPMLAKKELKEYIRYICDYILNGKIAAYTITNGTLVNQEILEFFREYRVNTGFSIDGIPEIHNKLRCSTHTKVMKAIDLYYTINGIYPPMNCTVGKEILDRTEDTISFFERFDSRVTFSRMIGKNGISLNEFHGFLNKAKKKLNIRTGGYDCTMYGGMCGAGINNIFYANGNIYICGNCVDLPPVADAGTPLDDIKTDIPEFDRHFCFREIKNGDDTE